MSVFDHQQIALNKMPSSISQLLQTGLEHHQSGRLQQAESNYQSILKEQPQHPEALHLLGVLSLQVGKSEVAVDLIEKAIKANPKEPEFYNMCGEAYRSLQKYDLAISRYEQALAIRPDFAGAHNNLGNACKEMGRVEDALAHYERAIATSPDFAMSHNNLGIALGELGRTEEAITHFKRAITIMPSYAEAHGNLGNALKESGRLEEAITHHEQAAAIRPDVAMAHYNLGIALNESGRPNDAVASYERALAINSDYAEAHHNLANALDELGRQQDAVAHYEKAIAINPDYAEAFRNLSTLKQQLEQAPAIEKLLEKPLLSETDKTHCHFALGNIYHQNKMFDKAFEHYKDGNTLKRKSVAYDPQRYTAIMDRLIDTYSKSYFEEIGAFGLDSELPVFIVGMPRSGTTLVEQIVSSHPQVHGAGELASLGRFEESIARQFGDKRPYPECMPQCDESTALRLSRNYLDELQTHSSDAKRVTDKMPSNFARIGLIKTMFPKARIIHCQRNALDTCTSNYFNYFAEGNEYSFDLDELANYYLDYQRIMNHWVDLFPSEIFAVQYEDLVTEQESVSRRLIEYLGLDWDDNCLEFYKNKRAVNSFSSSQVRQPIYAHSIDRWKDYEEQLAPLIAILPRTSYEAPAKFTQGARR